MKKFKSSKAFYRGWLILLAAISLFIMMLFISCESKSGKLIRNTSFVQDTILVWPEYKLKTSNFQLDTVPLFNQYDEVVTGWGIQRTYFHINDVKKVVGDTIYLAKVRETLVKILPLNAVE